MKTVAGFWRGYRDKVVPAEAGLPQIQETCRAFYAGASIMLAEMVRMADAEEECGEMTLARWIEECTEFARAVQRSDA